MSGTGLKIFLGFVLLLLSFLAKAGEMKNLDDRNFLTVEWDRKSHIASAFADLVHYYALRDLEAIRGIDIIFPQTSFEFPNGDVLVGIAFEGSARETRKVKIERMPGGTFYSVLHLGPYQELPGAIRQSFKSLLSDGYTPDDKLPFRLLYWNSPDDNLPKDLRTEILIPVE